MTEISNVTIHVTDICVVIMMTEIRVVMVTTESTVISLTILSYLSADDYDFLHHLPPEIEVYLGQTLLRRKVKLQVQSNSSVSMSLSVSVLSPNFHPTGY